MRWGQRYGINRNSKVLTLLLIDNDGVTTNSRIISISITKVTTNKGMISKYVLPLIKLISLVVTIGGSL